MIKKVLLGLSLWLGALAPSYGVVSVTNGPNAAYTITNTDVRIVTSVAFSASRTWTLPSAGGTCIGQNCVPAAYSLEIWDQLSTVTATNTLVIAPPSGNTINGNAANLILSAAGVRVVLTPTSSTNWQATVSGDFRQSVVLTASAVALTTATAANITSISLSQGVWSCSANTFRNLAAATSVTKLSSSISATTATSGLNGAGMATVGTAANVMGVVGHSVVVPPLRIALTETTTYYLVAEDVFTVDTNAAFGAINCYRQ